MPKQNANSQSGPSFKCPCCGESIQVAEDHEGEMGQNDAKKAGVKNIRKVLAYDDMMQKGN